MGVATFYERQVGQGNFDLRSLDPAESEPAMGGCPSKTQ
jgi:hypothetical protein